MFPPPSFMPIEDEKAAIFNALVAEISEGLSSSRQIIQSLRQDEAALDTKDGVSLLSLKYHLLLSYIKSLSLLAARRAIGHSLGFRSPPTRSIDVLDRDVRGNGAGDLVDAMVEYRVILEKMRALEARMRYQLNKLLRIAREPDQNGHDVDDPLSFRPNPQNLLGEQSDQGGLSDGSDEDEIKGTQDTIYRPPRVAPVPYVEQPKSHRKSRLQIPSALADLSQDPTRPVAESTSGLGSVPTPRSGRAGYLKRLQEYEEDTFSRLVMKKADAKRRLRDEADLALGGGLATSENRRRGQAGSLEDTFGDVLRSIQRKGGKMEDGLLKDGYEELRRKGRKSSAFERSREDNGTGKRFASPSDEDGGRRKRTRFELDSKRRKRLSKQ